MQTNNTQLKTMLEAIKQRNQQIKDLAREDRLNEFYRASMHKIGVKVFTSSYLTDTEKMKGGIK